MNPIENARDLLSTGPLCNSCLGRPFADRSFGLTNAERGRALRTTLALSDDEPYEEPDEPCWVCEGLCDRFDELAEAAVEELGETELYTYQVGSRVPPLSEENDRLLRIDAGLDPDVGEGLGTELNREVGRRVGRRLGADVDFERPDVQFLVDMEAGAIGVQRNSVSIYGRYRKLERGIPQTEWEKFDESVEELVAPPFLSAFRGTEAVFHGAGREDVDAQMVGSGRPFVLEIKQPRRRDADLEELGWPSRRDRRQGRNRVAGVCDPRDDRAGQGNTTPRRRTERPSISSKASGEPTSRRRSTRSRGRPSNSGAPPRRPPPGRPRQGTDRPRDRRVADRRVHRDGRGSRQGGLYIKELVSGDEGRTEPSLAGLLGVDATVAALDVTDVEGVDEPFLTPEFRLDREGDPVSGTDPAVSDDGPPAG